MEKLNRYPFEIKDKVFKQLIETCDGVLDGQHADGSWIVLEVLEHLFEGGAARAIVLARLAES